MTITINIPTETETLLQAEAARVGVPVEQLAARVIAERFETSKPTVKETTGEFFNRIGHPGPVIDVSRENIYADV